MKKFISKKDLLLILLSACFTFLLLEAFVRITGARGRIYDLEMWKYATQLKMKSQNPILGHEHIPNKTFKLQGCYVTTNSHGFRGREYSLEKPRNTKRILLLGDSITFGWGAPFDSIFSEGLKNQLNNAFQGNPAIEVINTGIGNYNSAMEVELFRTKGIKFSPDIVILNYFINDAEPIPKKSNNILLNMGTQFPVVLWSRGNRMLRLLDKKSSYKNYYSDLYNDDKPGWLAAQKSFRDLKEMCDSSKIRLIVCIIPELHNLTDNYPFKDIHQKVADVCSNLKIDCIDLLPYFKYKQEKSLWALPEDAHPNAAGHKIIADALFPVIRDALKEKSSR